MGRLLRAAFGDLRARLLLLIVGPALAVGLLVALGAVLVVERHANQELARSLNRARLGVTNALEGQIERLAGEAGIYVQSPMLVQALSTGADLEPIGRRLMALMARSGADIDEIVILDRDGAPLLYRAFDSALTDAAPLPLGQLVATPGGGRRGVVRRPDSGRMELAVVVPVQDAQGATVGQLGLTTIIDDNLARTMAARLRFELLFVNAIGSWGASDAGLAQALPPGWLKSDAPHRPDPLIAFSIGDLGYAAGRQPLQDAQGEALGSVVVLVRTGAWRLALTETVLLLVFVGVLVLLIAVPLAAWAGHRLAQPLAAMTLALRRLADGEPPPNLPALTAHTPSELSDLAHAVSGFRLAAEEQARLARRLNFLSSHDTLTGLPNRVLFQDRLEQALAAEQREGQGLALLAVDVDRFQEVNDTHGHQAGDELLRVLAERLSGVLRQSDTLARLSADEFAIIAPRTGRPEAVEMLAERMLSVMHVPFILNGKAVTATLSIGATMVALPGVISPAALLREADLGLREAKSTGRGRLCFYDSALNRRLEERRALERDLRDALAKREFFLVFQPQVSATDRHLTGAEVLLRWRHPERGLVPPDIFIPVAEEAGLIVLLGEWVLREACRVAKGWPNLRIAVNASAIQLREARFVTLVEQVLAETGLPPGRLELEITEGVMLHHTAETIGTLNRLRRAGVRIAMDDFGTGYSSLANLQRFPFDKIKLDRSFVAGALKDPSAAALVRAVMGIGTALGIVTNAEGVESEEQFELLRNLGCQEIQGFLIGKPMPAAEFEAAFVRQAI